MKASVLHAINDLRFEDVPLPELKTGEVLVNVRACGICGSDVGRALKSGAYHYPIVIGHEFSGVVTQSYDPENKKWIGKRVGIFPLKPCFSCNSCKEGKYEMCECYDYLGSRCNGGFEEYVAVPAWNLVELPDTVTFEEAAMLEPLSVGVHALRQVKSIKDKILAVIGPGTIGNIATAVAKSMGARCTIMIGRTDRKLEFASTYSSDYTINSITQDVETEVSKLTDGLAADIVIEGTGASKSLSTAINITRRGGDIILMGNPSGNMEVEKNVYWKILRRQLNLHGTWNSSFGTESDDWNAAIELLSSKEINLNPLITHRLKFSELNKGLSIMASPEEFSNKVILLNNE